MTLPPPQPEESPKGAPAWMLTFSDTMTLMLTFFVMMLTFSSSSSEEFGHYAQGLMAGSRWLPVWPGSPGADEASYEEQRLDEGRVSPQGAETPPTTQEAQLSELRKYYEDVDVNLLPELKSGVVIRIPLAELLDESGGITPSGQGILDRVARMARGKAYRTIVSCRPARGEPAEAGVAASLRVVGYLRVRMPETSRDVGVSTNIRALETPLDEGHCEIVMLEV